MTFAFDLISDLHIETWDNFDWTGQATSPYCIVAGDVARDRTVLVETLGHLGRCYPGGVFYIDGNDEHFYYIDSLGRSYRELSYVTKNIDNVVYMQDNVVIINGVAIIATNGWWGFDFDESLDYDQSKAWFKEKMNVIDSAASAVAGVSYNDANYLINSINKLQTHQDVKAIVIVTHTLPIPELVSHDPDLVDTWRFNTLGNKHMRLALDEDTENKVKVWCFGHYHRPVDRDFNGLRFVNNCRGRGDTPFKQVAYYPKRIEIDF